MTAAAVAVRERPIPFSGPMARAAHRFQKTQTRRVVLPQPFDGVEDVCPPDERGLWAFRRPAFDVDPEADCSLEVAERRCPYGQPGDRLWVKEAYRLGANLDALAPSLIPPGQLGRIAFEADGEERIPWPNRGRYRHGRFMPRRFSRTMLELTGVRVERVQDISEADAIAEGLLAQEGRGQENGYYWQGVGYHGGRLGKFGPTFHVQNSVGSCACKIGGPTPAQCAYRELWDSLNAERGYGWDVNPYVWVLPFTRVRA